MVSGDRSSTLSCNRSRLATDFDTHMMTADQIIQLLRASFPVDPVPIRFFSEDGGGRPVGDIPEELLSRIARRPWVEIAIHDWMMTGAHPGSARRYLDPTAFRYYLPSLLVGGLQQAEYIDWALDAILPPGRKYRTTGSWWKEFSEGFSAEQRAAVCAYLRGIKSLLRHSLDSADRQQIRDAEDVWGCPKSDDRQ
jgi:Family of unknown function (DUF6714)